jgi:hypothetical protein
MTENRKPLHLRTFSFDAALLAKLGLSPSQAVSSPGPTGGREQGARPNLYKKKHIIT